MNKRQKKKQIALQSVSPCVTMCKRKRAIAKSMKQIDIAIIRKNASISSEFNKIRDILLSSDYIILYHETS